MNSKKQMIGNLYSNDRTSKRLIDDPAVDFMRTQGLNFPLKIGKFTDFEEILKGNNCTTMPPNKSTNPANRGPTIVQLGGSVVRSATPQQLTDLIQEIIASDSIVINGGGPHHELARYYQRMFGLEQEVYDSMHHTAVLIQDRLTKHLGLNPYEQPLESYFSPDLNALRLGSMLNASQVVLLKDVEGIFERDPINRQIKEADVAFLQKIPDCLPDPKKNTVVIKVGGSFLDLVFYSSNSGFTSPHFLANFVQSVFDLREHYNLVITVGGGPSQDIVKDWKDVPDYNFTSNLYDDLSDLALRIHGHLLAGVLGKFGEYIPPTEIKKIDNEFFKYKIPVVTHIDPGIGKQIYGQEVTRSESDLHTFVFGDYFKASMFVYVKNTDSVKMWDPAFDENPSLIDDLLTGPNNSNISEDCRSQLETIRRLKNKGIENSCHDMIAIERFFDEANPIFRVGSDGRSGHLVEDSALHYFMDQSKVPITIICPAKSSYEFLIGELHRRLNLSE